MLRLIRHFSALRRALDTLVYLEAAAGGSHLTAASLLAVTAAQQLGEPVTALVTAPAVAAEAARAPVAKVLVAEGDHLQHGLAEELAPLFRNVLAAGKFSHFLLAALAVGKSALPRLAALCDVQPVSDVVAVKGRDTFVRPIYAGNALATVRLTDAVVMASVRALAFAAASLGAEAAPVERVETTPSLQRRATFVSEALVTLERPELGSAARVVAGGRGLKNRETFDRLLEPLAHKLGAAVGASRAAVDLGFCDNSLQIGQTGKIVAPDLYVAVGVLGAIQHLAGMKDSKTIVAINKDPEAPIFNVADIGLVADLTDAVPELIQKIG